MSRVCVADIIFARSHIYQLDSKTFLEMFHSHLVFSLRMIFLTKAVIRFRDIFVVRSRGHFNTQKKRRTNLFIDVNCISMTVTV